MAEKTTDIVPAENYEILRADEKTAEIIRSAVGPAGVDRFDLDRIRIPAGGATTWEVETLEGTENERALVGIVIEYFERYVYWKEPYSSGKQPPDCQSDDLVFGHGNPGGRCKACPNFQWNSAVDQSGKSARGKACKDVMPIFLVRPNAILPTMLVLPTMSVKNCRRFFLRFASQRKMPCWQAIVEIGLEKTKSTGGFDYGQATFKLIDTLSKENTAKVEAVRNAMLGQLQKVRIEGADYGGEATGDTDQPDRKAPRAATFDGDGRGPAEGGIDGS